MPALSPLQALPLHAIEMIVDNVAFNIRLTFGITHSSLRFEKYHILQMPLLWVCQVFRAVVYSRFSKCYKLWFDKDKVVEWPIPCTRCLKRLDGPFRLMAKELSISIDPWDVFSGKALVALSHMLYTDCSFPLARMLEIRFVNGLDNKNDSAIPPDANDNISAFIRWIRQMAPKISLVKLSDSRWSSGQTIEEIIYFDYLTRQLVQVASQIDIANGYGRAFRLQNVDAIRNLTHLHAEFDLGREQIMRLIRLNMSTLQNLRVFSRVHTDLSGIIRNADGSYAKYSHLHTLVAKLNTTWSTPRKYTFDGAAPFPSLRRLDCGGEYPFGDDMVLFRGDAATLKILQLALTRELAATLIKSKVFTRTSHPKLQCVMLMLHSSMRSANYADDPEIVHLLLDIAPGAAVKKVSWWFIDRAPPPVFSLFDKLTNLQVLALPDMRLSLWDAMTLIKSLPILSDLYARAPTLDPMPDGVTKHNLVTYVCSNYSPMATRFRCWHFGSGNAIRLRDTVKPFLLLALACPNFDYAAVVYYEREKFAKLLEKTTDTAAYKKHGTRLRRLLPHRPEEC